MAFWNVDLTTQDGAESATQMGAACCFAAAVLSAIGLALAAATYDAGDDRAQAITLVALVGVEIVIFIVAGLRFRARKGLIWGGVAALLLVLAIVEKIVTLTGLLGIVLNVVMLVGVINGIRGAAAMRGGRLTPDEAAGVFE